MKRKIIKILFGFFTKRIIRKYHPCIIAVTGSVGKTSAKNAIAAILARHTTIRKTEKNLNSAIGLPLAFIGGENAQGSIRGWLRNCMRAILLLVRTSRTYPRVIVVEMGADKPGDILYLTRIAKPHIAVVSAIGDVPVHVQFYKDSDAVVREKANIVRCLTAQDYAVLNRDDERVFSMRSMTKAHVMTYGFTEGSDVRIVNFEMKKGRSETGNEIPVGISFQLQYADVLVPVSISGVLGKPVAYACAAGVTCAILSGMDIALATDAFSHFENEPGRMRIIEGINGSMILDDTYNAAPAAMRATLDTFSAVPAKRKIAILGDMLELGSYAQKVHEDTGTYAARICDQLIFIGPLSEFGYKAALQNGFGSDKVSYYISSQEAIDAVRKIPQDGDVILVKGSQGMRMERIVKGLMANPEQAKSLLVRQTKEWG